MFTTIHYYRMQIKSSGLLRSINVNLTHFFKPKCTRYRWVKTLLLQKLYLPGRIRFLFPAEARDISVLQNFQAGSGVYPASYSVDTLVFFFGGKAAKA